MVIYQKILYRCKIMLTIVRHMDEGDLNGMGYVIK